MKPKHYLLSLSAFGLLMMFPVAWVVTGESPLGMILSWFPPLLLGGAWTLALGKGMDYVLEGRRLTLVLSLLASMGIFAFGVLGGATFNFLLNANLYDDYRIYSQFFDWFVKPVYWLYLFGLPSSIAVGASFYFIRRFFQKTNAPA
jgi:hypothetical protein